MRRREQRMAFKILLVDDDPQVLTALGDQLRLEGYNVLAEERGQQALALAEEFRPDLILLDAAMPGMDGIETCRRLQLNPATAAIPVILMSDGSLSEARDAEQRAGAADTIIKPVHILDLLEHIERLVRLRDRVTPDYQRLLDEITYTALTVLHCDLVWLLVADRGNHCLTHRAAASDGDVDRDLLERVRRVEPDIRFPLIEHSNPIVDAVLDRVEWANLPTAELVMLPGGQALEDVFAGYAYLSLLPLVTAGQVVGLMVLASRTTPITQTQHPLLNSLRSQAAIVMHNSQLIADLAVHDQQIRAEQTFRQMVLDTMGEGLIVVDADGRITYVNRRLLWMTSYSRAMLYGQSVGIIFDPANRKELVQSLIGQRHTLPFAQRLCTRSGQLIPVLLSRAVMPLSDGDSRGTVLVVTDLSELQRQEVALKFQTERLQAINQATNLITSSRSLEQVVQLSAELALQVVHGSAASVLLRDNEQLDMLTVVSSAGDYQGSGRIVRISESTGLAGWVASTGKSQIIGSVANQEYLQTYYSEYYGADICSLVAVPLFAADRVIGVLEVILRHSGTFEDQDLETLESLAGTVAITIENVRLFEQMRRRVIELSTLLDASAAVTSTLDFGDILERIARRLSLALQVDRVIITSWNSLAIQLEALGEVVNAYWQPGSGPIYAVDRLPLTRLVFETGNMALASLPSQEKSPSGLRALGSFPVNVNGHFVAVAVVSSEEPHRALAEVDAEATREIIAQWEQIAGAQEPRQWLSRANLTDLCQRVLQTSRTRWCSIMYWDRTQQAARLVREIGRALWMERPGSTWDVGKYSSLQKALQSGEVLTLQVDQLDHDPHEQAYLQSVGGHVSLVAPLFIRGEPGGVIKLIDSRSASRIFDAAELSLCQGIANVVGNAMENAQLYTAQEQRASALEAAYTELTESDRLKEELLQNLSHELRTPLTHILGYMSLVLDDAFGSIDGELRASLELVNNKALHLADLVKHIMLVQESEIDSLNFKPVHLDRVIALAIRSIAGQAQARDIRVISSIPDDLAPVFADPTRIGELFEELLENAVKFSPDSSQVEVRVEDSGGPMLHVSVRDQGIGIHPSEHEKIFRRFYQVDSGTTRRFGGTGLGLAIVRSIVEGHNGRIWVESTLDEGSCFHLTLPKALSAIQQES